MKSFRLMATTILVMSTIGCANLPDVNVGYYLSESKIGFKVVRTVTCDQADNIIVINGATPTVSHFADLTRFETVPLVKLKGDFTDTDIKFDFYDDGRLKDINATNSGQGEAIFKTLVSVASAIVAWDGNKITTYPEECKFIRAAGGGKPITLNYEGDVELKDMTGKDQDIPPDIASQVYAAQIGKAIGGVRAIIQKTENTRPPAAMGSGALARQLPTAVGVPPAVNGDGTVPLYLRQPGSVTIQVETYNETIGKADLWKGALPVAQFGTDYMLPIPNAAAFGKEVFAATFSESGALSSLQYIRNTGAGPLLNAISPAVTAAQGDTITQKLADTKAAADYIVQQQRLATCRATPVDCK